jgi:hypothetical protein
VRDGGAIAPYALPFAIIDFSDLPGVWADQVRRVALEHSEARITEAILRDGQVSAGSRHDERCPGSRGADDVNRPRRVDHVRREMPREQPGVSRRSRLGERFAGHPPGPAHPQDGCFGMVAELLRYTFAAAPRAELANGAGDGLPDLLGGGFVGPLQRRREQSVGSDGIDAEVVYRWPHRGLLTSSIPRLHHGGTTILRTDTAASRLSAAQVNEKISPAIAEQA